jgi:hypothetical protein
LAPLFYVKAKGGKHTLSKLIKTVKELEWDAGSSPA